MRQSTKNMKPLRKKPVLVIFVVAAALVASLWIGTQSADAEEEDGVSVKEVHVTQTSALGTPKSTAATTDRTPLDAPIQILIVDGNGAPIPGARVWTCEKGVLPLFLPKGAKLLGVTDPQGKLAPNLVTKGDAVYAQREGKLPARALIHDGSNTITLQEGVPIAVRTEDQFGDQLEGLPIACVPSRSISPGTKAVVAKWSRARSSVTDAWTGCGPARIVVGRSGSTPIVIPHDWQGTRLFVRSQAGFIPLAFQEGLDGPVTPATEENCVLSQNCRSLRYVIGRVYHAALNVVGLEGFIRDKHVDFASIRADLFFESLLLHSLSRMQATILKKQGIDFLSLVVPRKRNIELKSQAFKIVDASGGKIVLTAPYHPLADGLKITKKSVPASGLHGTLVFEGLRRSSGQLCSKEFTQELLEHGGLTVTRAGSVSLSKPIKKLPMTLKLPIGNYIWGARRMILYQALLPKEPFKVVHGNPTRIHAQFRRDWDLSIVTFDISRVGKQFAKGQLGCVRYYTPLSIPTRIYDVKKEMPRLFLPPGTYKFTLLSNTAAKRIDKEVTIKQRERTSVVF